MGLGFIFASSKNKMWYFFKENGLFFACESSYHENVNMNGLHVQCIKAVGALPDRRIRRFRMKKRWCKTVGMILTVCLLCSMLPIGSQSADIVMAAENGTLQNGELSANTEGWTIEGDCPVAEVEAGKDFLNVFGGDGDTAPDTSTFKMSQTIVNVKAGAYTAGISMTGEGNNLTLTIKNETTGIEELAFCG